MRCAVVLILYVASVNAISKSRRGLFNVIHENESSPQSIDSRLKKDAFSSLKSELESQGQIIANPNPYFNLDDLTVSWNDISCPNNGDWIGVFVPELYRTDSASDVGYIDWQYVSDASPSTYLQGYGSMTFPKAMNLRNYIEFRYFSKNSTCGQKADATWSLISTSDKVNPVDLNEPTQLHLSIGNHYTTMVLSFVTNAPQNATLYYGTSPSNLNNKAVGTFTSYSADMMCATPATYTYAPYFCDPGYLHAVSMVDLHPRQTYYYQAQAGGSMSPIYNFTSAPVAGSEDIVKMFAFGDMGGHQTGTQGTLDKLRQHIDDYDIVLHIGDISYAEGNALEWDRFGSEIMPIASARPYMVSIGNHEYDYTVKGTNDPSLPPGPASNGFHPVWGNYGTDSGGECGVPAYYRFTAPQSAGSNAIFWYSFGYGSTFIIQMSSEHDFTTNSTQFNWLESTLRSVNRKVYPWVIVTTHRPMYTSENYAGDYEVSVYMQQYLESLFLQYRVDLVLAGHYHSYERTCAVRKGVCVSGGTDFGIVHVVIGMAGMSLDAASYMKKDWSVFHDQVFGYTIIESNSTQLAMFYHHNANDELADKFVLQK